MRSNTECWSNKQLNDRIEFLEDKLGDISRYPEIKFGHMTVLDYLDLVELQADTYTKRALIAEQKLRDTILIVKEITEGKGRYDRDSFLFVHYRLSIICTNRVERILLTIDFLKDMKFIICLIFSSG